MSPTTTRQPAQGEVELGVRTALRAARRAQDEWRETALADRLAVVRRARRLLARDGDRLADAVHHRRQERRAETVAAEILPLADACRFLEKSAPEILRPRPLTGRGPLWLGRSRLVQHREPLGVILIIGPGNYPLFLPGVQTLQALVAGNSALLKPGQNGRRAALELARILDRAGLPPGLLSVLPEEPEAAQAAIRHGVDKAIFTGSASTGRSVLADLAQYLTPSTMELSGCDAVFVRDDADLDLTARALRFGFTLNDGATCMAPRRIFVAADQAKALEKRLETFIGGLDEVELSARTEFLVKEILLDALDRGARPLAGVEPPRNGRMKPLILADVSAESDLFSSDLMAPVMGLCPVADDDAALAAAAACPYALGAAIFSRRGGDRLAENVNAGVVVFNDLIAPTADPRLAFGGRAESGFGLTRGAEGLLELTALKTVIRRRASWQPHLRTPGPEDDHLLLALLRAVHGGAGQRLRGLRDLIRSARRTRTEKEKNDRKTARGGRPLGSAQEGV